MSRQSNLAFSNVDFQYTGDSSHINHLINHRIGAFSPNKVQLGYELNLRTYHCDTTFKAKEPWMFPKTKDFPAVVVDKGAFHYRTEQPHGTPVRVDNSKYSDQFRPRNMQLVKHAFLAGNMSLA
jgi:hypothetical protein